MLTSWGGRGGARRPDGGDSAAGGGVTSEQVLAHQRDVIERIATGEPVDDVLRRIAAFAEEHSRVPMVCNVMLYDAGTDALRCIGHPSLPDSFRAGVDGLRPGPAAGSCGTAAFRRAAVVSPDVRTDPLWEGFVPFMLDHGFMAAWSLPILAPADGRLLGTFGVYHDRPHDPAPDEMDLVELHVYLAALAVERHESDRRLRYQAEHDALTGLLGRDAFFRRLADAMRAAGPSEPVALALLDVDGLQQVNETRGHRAGDAVLRQLAGRLAERAPADAVLGRYSGDAYLVMLPGHDIPSARAVVADLLTAFWAPMAGDGRALRVTACAGLAEAEPGIDADELVGRADAAVRDAQRRGRASVRVYDSTLSGRVADRARLATALQAALERDEIRVAYQPIVDLNTGEVLAVEALARWDTATPDVFIPLAEACGLIHELGMRVLERSVADLAGWIADGHDLALHVNLSPAQLGRPDLPQVIDGVLAAHGIRPDRVSLEVVESAALADAQARDVLDALRDTGFTLAIDDFGTGYSSPGLLAAMPFGTLKMDRSFVSRIEDAGFELAIVRLLVGFGRELGMRIVAEGVETEAQRRVLATLGCQLGQGYLFARPGSVHDVAGWLSGPIAPGIHPGGADPGLWTVADRERAAAYRPVTVTPRTVRSPRGGGSLSG